MKRGDWKVKEWRADGWRAKAWRAEGWRTGGQKVARPNHRKCELPAADNVQSVPGTCHRQTQIPTLSEFSLSI